MRYKTKCLEDQVAIIHVISFSFSDTLSPIEKKEKTSFLHLRNIHNYNSMHIDSRNDTDH